MPSGRSGKTRQATPAIDQSFLDAPWLRELRQLALFVLDEPGFRLAIATYDRPPTRDAALSRLKSEVAPRGLALSVLDLRRHPAERILLRRLRQHLRRQAAPAAGRQAVMIVGLEATFDLGGDDLTMLANMNLQRDAFAEQCPLPIVLWLSRPAARVLARSAPDFWHWRSVTFDFEGPEAPDLAPVDAPAAELADEVPADEERVRRLISVLADQLEESPDAATPGQRAARRNLLTRLGIELGRVGEHEEAIARLGEALGIARDLGELAAEVEVLEARGHSRAALGDTDRAIDDLEQALSAARRLGDRRREVEALTNLGAAHAARGDFQRALGCYETALPMARAARLRHLESRLLANVALALARLGRPEESLETLETGLDLAREQGDRRAEGRLLGNLGSVLGDLGRLEEALEAAEEAVEIFRRLAADQPDAFQPDLATSLNNLGNRLSDLGRHEEALEATTEAVRTLAPFFERLPKAFAEWMRIFVSNYRQRAGGAGRPVDSELLEPILAKFEHLSENV